MAPKNLYGVLGVEKSASDAEIKKAYRRIARKSHPDVNPGDRAAEERFKEAAAAFGVLSDPEKRQLYDEYGDEAARIGFDPERAKAERDWRTHRQRRGSSPGGGAPWEEAFAGRAPSEGTEGWPFDLNEILGGFARRRRTRRPTSAGGDPAGRADLFREQGSGDIEASMSVDLVDALRGAEREILVNKSAGRGAPGQPTESVRLQVKIPKGVHDGQRIRLRGQGIDLAGDGTPGDLFITIRVDPHALVSREGDDLFMRVPVTLAEAMLGAKIEVPTLDGGVNVTIPPGSQSGRKLRLKGKGVPGRKNRPAGDLYVTLVVKLPELPADSPQTREAVEAIERLEKFYKGDLRGGLKL